MHMHISIIGIFKCFAIQSLNPDTLKYFVMFEDLIFSYKMEEENTCQSSK